MKITNAKVFINGQFHEGLEVRYNEKEILEIGQNLNDEEVIDANGNYLFAGIIDCHNHGGWLRNFTDNQGEIFGTYQEKISFLCDKLPSCGVTTVMPTLDGDDTLETMSRSVREMRRMRPFLKGSKLYKFHYESTFHTLDRYLTDHEPELNIENTDILVDYDYSDIAIISVGPDQKDAEKWCDYVVSKGVYPQVSDSKATYEDVIKCADHGLCQADHIFNGYEPMHHRKSGAAVAVLLDDRIKAQITLDGYHVNASWVELTLKAKGIKNCYGITDQSSCSGLPEGEHTLPDGKVVIAKDGFIKYPDGYIVSGNMTMNQIMKAARDKCHLTKEQVGLLYCENVADCLNIKDRGKIEVGRMSDFVIMNEDYEVIKTIIDGQIYYQK